jgi:hypothetical protein
MIRSLLISTLLLLATTALAKVHFREDFSDGEPLLLLFLFLHMGIRTSWLVA